MSNPHSRDNQHDQSIGTKYNLRIALSFSTASNCTETKDLQATRSSTSLAWKQRIKYSTSHKQDLSHMELSWKTIILPPFWIHYNYWHYSSFKFNLYIWASILCNTVHRGWWTVKILFITFFSHFGFPSSSWLLLSHFSFVKLMMTMIRFRHSDIIFHGINGFNAGFENKFKSHSCSGLNGLQDWSFLGHFCFISTLVFPIFISPLLSTFLLFQLHAPKS